MNMNLIGKVFLIIFFRMTQLMASDIQVGVLSDGACWYESKDNLKLVSFNEKKSYSGTHKAAEAEIASLVPQIGEAKVRDVDLVLHCGGNGLSLVAKVFMDDHSFCVWAKVENGKWLPRSVGLLSDKGKSSELCDGYKWGEFILGINSTDYLSELQSTKWATMIKEISLISHNTYKVVLTREYEFRENEVMNQIEENFTGKNFIRYLEYNEYRHPVGEFIPLK